MAKWRSKKAAEAADGAPKAAVVGGEGDDLKATAAEVVISVPVHCDGCARKLHRSVRRLDGVEEVTVDCRTDTVVVRGRKAAEDPAGVVEVVERRTGKKALLLSSSPAKLPPAPPEKNGEQTKKDVAHEDMDEGVEMVVIMRIDLHCEACSEEIKRRIFKIKGVEDVVPHMKSSQVTVKGTVEPATLAGLIHKRTGRRAAIIRAEPVHPPLPPPAPDDQSSPPPPPKVDEPPPPPPMALETEAPPEKKERKDDDDGSAVEKSSDGSEDEKRKINEEAHENDNSSNINGAAEESRSSKDHQLRVPAPAAVVEVAPPDSEKTAMNSSNLYQYCYYYPAAYPYAYHPCQQYHQYPQLNSAAAGNYPASDMYGYYPQHQHVPEEEPDEFSDENPNACSVM
ncbi:hypothetical protein GUJ93_ZPchr0013g34381 [Zizania palustris]|uniref:HMA domain-containing protein n=1 Tax=Zizania palustris TaxID=103762 RepID=A0A8J5X8Y0_ZIZPA|nr:hypothetical protein GUJ93_ZPchr0013g34381 [Zizania palustris]